MALNDNEKADLLRMIDSDTFKKGMGEISKMIEVSMRSGMLAPEMAVALAYEKGVLDVPALLLRATTPATPGGNRPPLANRLDRTSTSQTSTENQ